MLIEPGTVLDRYVVGERIGEGADAVVYRAHHAALGTPYALKVLRVPPSPEGRDRLLREGRVQARLRHANVIAVRDVVGSEAARALVMDLVEGPSLAELLRRSPPTLAEADALARGILAGVAAAHAAGLVHRDLKPANVLVEPTAAGPVPKVTDFGLAKVLEPGGPGTTISRTGESIGTPAYMSPEQLRDWRRVDARSDVFALGAVLYELVTGQRAFPGDVLAVVDAVSHARYAPLPAQVPARMRRAIAAALQVDPERRPADGGALLALWAEDGPTRAAAEHGAPPARSSRPRSDPPGRSPTLVVLVVLAALAAWTLLSR